MKVAELFETAKYIDFTSLSIIFRDPYPGSLNCNREGLTSLKGCPTEIETHFRCNANFIKSLEYSPSKIGGYCNFDNNRITSLKGIHTIIKYIAGTLYVTSNPIKNGYIDVLKIEHAPISFLCNNDDIEEIINKHLSNKNIKERVQLAIEEFIDKDLEEFI